VQRAPFTLEEEAAALEELVETLDECKGFMCFYSIILWVFIVL
jgi:hypothetical protein